MTNPLNSFTPQQIAAAERNRPVLERGAAARKRLDQLKNDPDFARDYRAGKTYAIDAYNQLEARILAAADTFYTIRDGEQQAADRAALDQVNRDLAGFTHNPELRERLLSGEASLVAQYNSAIASKAALMPGSEHSSNVDAVKSARDRMGALMSDEKFMARYDAGDPIAKAEWSDANTAHVAAIQGEQV
jgi:hypothetical protein